jgi:hypothetical protein
MCDRASVAVADHSDRRDGKRRGAESEAPIGYGKRLLQGSKRSSRSACNNPYPTRA